MLGKKYAGLGTVLVIIMLSIESMGQEVSETRTWTDSTGNFKVTAKLVAVQGEKVVLRRQNGKQIIVALVKLSEKDRIFLKTGPTDNSTTGNAGEAEVIAETARRFFSDLRNSDRTVARQLLTTKAQPLMQGKQTLLAQLPQPASANNAIRVGKAKFDGKVAEISIHVRAAGELHKTKLHFRFETEQWRVFALSATYPEGEKSINFEAEGVTKKNANPLQSLVGKPLELSGYMLDGSPLEMANYRDKVVLVDFWATWCGPCLAEIPNILQNWKKYHDDGFEVIAISVDRDLEALHDFVNQEQPPWTVVADNHPNNTKSMGAKYGIRGIPAFILIGKDGQVAAVNCRGQQLGKQLDRLLGGRRTGVSAVGANSPPLDRSG